MDQQIDGAAEECQATSLPPPLRIDTASLREGSGSSPPEGSDVAAFPAIHGDDDGLEPVSTVTRVMSLKSPNTALTDEEGRISPLPPPERLSSVRWRSATSTPERRVSVALSTEDGFEPVGSSVTRRMSLKRPESAVATEDGRTQPQQPLRRVSTLKTRFCEELENATVTFDAFDADRGTSDAMSLRRYTTANDDANEPEFPIPSPHRLSSLRLRSRHTLRRAESEETDPTLSPTDSGGARAFSPFRNVFRSMSPRRHNSHRLNSQRLSMRLYNPLSTERNTFIAPSSRRETPASTTAKKVSAVSKEATGRTLLVALLLQLSALLCFASVLCIPAPLQRHVQAAAKPAVVEIRGKVLYVDGEEFFVRGVNYNPIPKGEDGTQHPFGEYYGPAYSQSSRSSSWYVYASHSIWEGLVSLFRSIDSFHEVHLRDHPPVWVAVERRPHRFLGLVPSTGPQGVGDDAWRVHGFWEEEGVL